MRHLQPSWQKNQAVGSAARSSAATRSGWVIMPTSRSPLAAADDGTRTATRKYRNMKARLRTHGGVTTLAKAYSLRCGLRLALGTKSSLSFCFATSVLQY